MKRLLIALAALGLIAQSNAQLWDGSPLPPSAGAPTGIDPYFVPPGPGPAGLSEFDSDSGYDFSLAEGGTVPAGITEANGWFNAASYAVSLDTGDRVRVTYLGKTAGWINDFGFNIGGANAYGAGAGTFWAGITNTSPGFGSYFSGVWTGAPTIIDFWLNSGGPLAPVVPALGGTYSIFFPGTSIPSNSGLPGFDYSARGRVFTVYDNGLDAARTILVIAIEDWRSFDADFTDMFFAIEIYDRDGNPQFPVPEPSTYGLIGAMLLLGLVVVRRARRS